MSKQLLDAETPGDEPSLQQKYPRHPITMENTPEETIRRMEAFPERASKFRETMRALREEAEKKHGDREEPAVQKKYPRHPITMENTPEETIRIMEAFPERAAKIRELIRGLRKTDSR